MCGTLVALHTLRLRSGGGRGDDDDDGEKGALARDRGDNTQTLKSYNNMSCPEPFEYCVLLLVFGAHDLYY